MAAKSRAGSRVSTVAESLRSDISAGILKPGDKLPIESQLAERFDVSRPTVRAALRELQAMQLVRTQHGIGSFVQEPPAISAGLEKLDSITESIRATGREPGMKYHSRLVRPLMPDEAERLSLAPNDLVLELRRSILADSQVVAYSYDLMPVGVFPVDGNPADLNGSLFAYLRKERGLDPAYATAEIHAVSSAHIGWDPITSEDSLYLLLDQVHYSADATVLLYSRTYFIEGRYTFAVARAA